jgi:peptidoglycan/xylan/chitin deacetylase (PgdA/CDA1 family)
MRRLLDLIGTGLEPVFLLMAKASQAGSIFLYHRVSPQEDSSYTPTDPALFELHCQLIKRHFSVLALGDFIDRYASQKSLRSCCAITFDDGYRDFLDFAYPVLLRHQLPATHFLVTECVLSGRPTWNLRLNRLLAHDNVGRFNERRVAAKSQLERLSLAERESWLSSKEKTIGLPVLPAMLLQEDLNHFDKSLVEWGSHTCYHSTLPGVPYELLRDELETSRAVLESLLDIRPRFFSYPNGAHDHAAREAARRCGYEAAFTVGQKRVERSSPLFALPRIGMDALPRGMVSMELCGVTPGLRTLRHALSG